MVALWPSASAVVAPAAMDPVAPSYSIAVHVPACWQTPLQSRRAPQPQTAPVGEQPFEPPLPGPALPPAPEPAVPAPPVPPAPPEPGLRPPEPVPPVAAPPEPGLRPPAPVPPEATPPEPR